MAEQALEKLDEQLNCAICLDTYTEPKILQCFHVYCRKCLVKLVLRDQQGQLILTCPTCRKVTSIPDSGVSGLQAAFHIDHLLEIRNSFEKVQESAITKEREATGITPEERVILKCSQHIDKELEVYCETCEEVICLECVLKGGKHQGHESITLKGAFDKYQGEIMSSLEPIEKQLMTINSALAQLNTRRVEISNKQAAVEDNIHNNFRRLHEMLDVRKTELIGELHQMTQGKLKSLATQKDQIETTQAQLSSCLDVMRESLRKGRREEVLMRKNTIAKLVKELTATSCQPDTLKPNTEADMAFSASSDMSALCQNYGRITLAPDPSKCYMKDIQEVAKVDEKTTALLWVVNSKNEPYKDAIDLLEIVFVSEIRGSTAKGSVERRGENQYEISYQPTMKGRHQLHIKIDSHHIRGSPFTVAVRAQNKKLGTHIKIVKTVFPVGVAVLQNGQIIASSSIIHCLSVFSPGGRELRSFGTPGPAQGQFNSPSDVAVDGEGNILVTDTGNHRIQKFTADGYFLTAVGTEGNGPLQFKRPCGITFNASNNKVYVTDPDNHRIQVLNSDLTFSSTFGKYGSGRGQFDAPQRIACDSTGKVYVADGNSHCIQVFTAGGVFLRVFGRCGQGRGELSGPVGVAVDTSDKVYVSEWKHHRVSVFSSKGLFLSSFGKFGSKPGEFNCPLGLAVDSSGVVYVCDNDNSRIQLF